MAYVVRLQGQKQPLLAIKQSVPILFLSCLQTEQWYDLTLGEVAWTCKIASNHLRSLDV